MRTKKESRLFSWRRAIAESDLPTTARLVAWTLSLHMNESGLSCFPAIRTVARESGCSPSTVRAAIAALRENGYLAVTERRRDDGGQSSNEYEALIPAAPAEQAGGGRDADGGLRLPEGGAPAPGGGGSGSRSPRGRQERTSTEKREVEKTLDLSCAQARRGRRYVPHLDAREDLRRAIAAAVGIDPATFTRSTHQAVGMCLSEITDESLPTWARATPRRVLVVAAWLREKWGDDRAQMLTVHALRTHWSEAVSEIVRLDSDEIERLEWSILGDRELDDVLRDPTLLVA